SYLTYIVSSCVFCHSIPPRVPHSLFSFSTPPSPHFYSFSLHDALPISCLRLRLSVIFFGLTASSAGLSALPWVRRRKPRSFTFSDRKSTRLNSSHVKISYAVFCLKKKIKII